MIATLLESGGTGTHTEERNPTLALVVITHRLLLRDGDKGSKIDHGGEPGGTGYLRFRQTVYLLQKHLTKEEYEQFWNEINDNRSEKIALAPYGYEQQKLPTDLEITLEEFVAPLAHILGL